MGGRVSFALRTGRGVGRESHTGELFCLALVKETDQKFPVEWHGERSEPEDSGLGYHLTIFSEVIFPVNIQPF